MKRGRTNSIGIENEDYVGTKHIKHMSRGRSKKEKLNKLYRYRGRIKGGALVPRCQFFKTMGRPAQYKTRNKMNAITSLIVGCFIFKCFN